MPAFFAKGKEFFQRYFGKIPLLNDTFSPFLSAFSFVANNWFTE
jgi:hypothetical protein